MTRIWDAVLICQGALLVMIMILMMTVSSMESLSLGRIHLFSILITIDILALFLVMIEIQDGYTFNVGYVKVYLSDQTHVYATLKVYLTLVQS